MSVFEKLFGGKKKGETVSTVEAIQRLRGIEEVLNKKQLHLESKINEEIEIAKKNGTKNKRAALQALARKRRMEKQLQQMDGTLTTLEFQREALENASTNTEVLKAMQVAAKSLKSAHNDMNVDKVHDVMDEIHEQHEIANEIADAISNPVGFGHDVDEDDLMAELEELEAEETEKRLLDVGQPDIRLPTAPSGEIAGAISTKSRTKEDDDLAELEAWAS